MRNREEKKRKQDSYQPINIKLVLKMILVIAGCIVWGKAFLLVALAVWLTWGILKGVLSCLLSLAVLIAFVVLLFTII